MPRFPPRQLIRSLPAFSLTRKVAYTGLAYPALLPSRKFTSSGIYQEIPFPSVQSCPGPTCFCASTPNLEIDRQTRISGTAPSYSQHIVIHTGRQDWRSRIEDEGDTDRELTHTKEYENPGLRDFIDGKQVAGISYKNSQLEHKEIGFARGLKKGLGRGGKFFDPSRTVLVTNSSLRPPENGPSTVAATILPSFKRISGIPNDSAGYEAFMAGLFTNSKHFSFPDLWTKTSLEVPVVLICSHASRDSRCGIMGPLLYAEFIRQLSNMGLFELSQNVTMCSHLSGHKWAGNLIIYLPLGWPLLMPGSDEGFTLRGKGVWYGRVEPKHVEGLIQETIIGGRVVEELSRGVVL